MKINEKEAEDCPFFKKTRDSRDEDKLRENSETES